MDRRPSQATIIDEKKLASIKQASRFVAVGVFVVLLALIGISGYQLYSINEDIAANKAVNQQVKTENQQLETERQQLEQKRDQMRAEIESLEKQWEVASRQIAEQGSFARTLTAGELRQAPVSMTVEPRASSTPIDDRLFLFRIWLDVPDRLRPRIDKVSYFFNHPTFRRKVLDSRDPNTDFAVEYRGWGALDRVIITIEMADATTRDIAFNMLAALDGALEDANGDNARKKRVKKAPIKSPMKRAPRELPMNQHPN